MIRYFYFSRKEFKPTIPIRRKKHSVNAAKHESLIVPPDTEKTSNFDEKLKERLSGKPNTSNKNKVSSEVPHFWRDTISTDSQFRKFMEWHHAEYDLTTSALSDNFCIV